MKLIKRLIKLSFLFVLLLWTGRFCRTQTDGFTLFKIQPHLHYDPRWEVDSSSLDEIKPVLAQKFHYLSKGAQCYVFESEDHQYVIKFFRQSLYHLPQFYTHLPLPTALKNRIEKKLKKKKAAYEKDFQSYKIAYQHLREETGLIFLHLNSSKNGHFPFTIVDKLGIEHQIDLHEYEFYVQRKADLVLQKIDFLMHNNSSEFTKEAIHSLFTLIAKRFDKGIQDTDPNMKKNFGFIGNQAVQIDIGRFSTENFSKEQALKSFCKKNEGFQYWINQNYPELSSFFAEECQKFKNQYELQN